MVAAFDALWVPVRSSPEGCAGELLKLDPSTGRVLARLSVDGLPSDVDVGFGSLWLTFTRCGAPVVTGGLLRIAPSLEESTEVAIPPSHGSPALSIGEAHVWLNYGQPPDGHGSFVAAVSPDSLDVVAQAQFEGGVSIIGEVEGLVWIIERRFEDEDYYPVIARAVALDSMGLAARCEVPLRLPGRAIAGGGLIWVDDSPGAIALAGDTGELVAGPLRIDGGFWPFWADEAGVCFAGQNERGEPRVAHLDGATLREDVSIMLGDYPAAFAVDSAARTFWIAGERMALVRVEF